MLSRLKTVDISYRYVKNESAYIEISD